MGIRQLVLGLCASIGVCSMLLGAIRIAEAGSVDCKFRIAADFVGGVWKFKDNGACDQFVVCDTVSTCEETVYIIGLSWTYCTCGDYTPLCANMFNGPSGGEGSMGCINSGCSSPCVIQVPAGTGWRPATCHCP